MAKRDIEKRLHGIPQETLDAAEEKLAALCEEHDLSPIRLMDGTGKWRELCYRMCGIPYEEKDSRGSGRPQKYSDDEVVNILNQLDVLMAFEICDTELEAMEIIGKDYDLLPDQYKLLRNKNKSSTMKGIKRRSKTAKKNVDDKRMKEDYEIDYPDKWYAENHPEEYERRTRNRRHKKLS